MRWPWVSRALYEEIVERLEAERARYDELSAASDKTLAAAKTALADAKNYEHLWHAEQRRADRAEDYVRYERKRSDDLFAAYQALRVQGANPGPQKLPAVEKPQLASDLAIEEKVKQFGGSARRQAELRRVLVNFQQRARASETLDEEAIASRVLNWSDPDEDAA
jgi:hypothetical protein